MVKSAQVERIIELAHEYLSRQSEAVTERQLLVELAQYDVWSHLDKGSAVIQQFRKHFLTMHALYRLQRRLTRSDTRLRISPGAIFLQRADAPSATTPSEADEVLRDYYLDLKQLKIYNETVANSPDEYKRRYSAWQQHRESYATLELSASATWLTVQAAYRRKAVQCHPDKGGNAQDFQKVLAAYQDLKRTLRP